MAKSAGCSTDTSAPQVSPPRGSSEEKKQDSELPVADDHCLGNDLDLRSSTAAPGNVFSHDDQCEHATESGSSLKPLITSLTTSFRGVQNEINRGIPAFQESQATISASCDDCGSSSSINDPHAKAVEIPQNTTDPLTVWKENHNSISDNADDLPELPKSRSFVVEDNHLPKATAEDEYSTANTESHSLSIQDAETKRDCLVNDEKPSRQFTSAVDEKNDVTPPIPEKIDPQFGSPEYTEKGSHLRKYVPLLHLAILKLEKDAARKDQLHRVRLLFNVATGWHHEMNRMPYANLLKCEEIMQHSRNWLIKEFGEEASNVFVAEGSVSDPNRYLEDHRSKVISASAHQTTAATGLVPVKARDAVAALSPLQRPVFTTDCQSVVSPPFTSHHWKHPIVPRSVSPLRQPPPYVQQQMLPARLQPILPHPGPYNDYYPPQSGSNSIALLVSPVQQPHLQQMLQGNDGMQKGAISVPSLASTEYARPHSPVKAPHVVGASAGAASPVRFHPVNPRYPRQLQPNPPQYTGLQSPTDQYLNRNMVSVMAIQQLSPISSNRPITPRSQSSVSAVLQLAKDFIPRDPSSTATSAHLSAVQPVLPNMISVTALSNITQPNPSAVAVATLRPSQSVANLAAANAQKAEVTSNAAPPNNAALLHIAPAQTMILSPQSLVPVTVQPPQYRPPLLVPITRHPVSQSAHPSMQVPFVATVPQTPTPSRQHLFTSAPAIAKKSVLPSRSQFSPPSENGGTLVRGNHMPSVEVAPATATSPQYYVVPRTLPLTSAAGIGQRYPLTTALVEKVAAEGSATTGFASSPSSTPSPNAVCSTSTQYYAVYPKPTQAGTPQQSPFAEDSDNSRPPASPGVCDNERTSQQFNYVQADHNGTQSSWTVHPAAALPSVGSSLIPAVSRMPLFVTPTVHGKHPLLVPVATGPGTTNMPSSPFPRAPNPRPRMTQRSMGYRVARPLQSRAYRMERLPQRVSDIPHLHRPENDPSLLQPVAPPKSISDFSVASQHLQQLTISVVDATQANKSAQPDKVTLPGSAPTPSAHLPRKLLVIDPLTNTTVGYLDSSGLLPENGTVHQLVVTGSVGEQVKGAVRNDFTPAEGIASRRRPQHVEAQSDGSQAVRAPPKQVPYQNRVRRPQPSPATEESAGNTCRPIGVVPLTNSIPPMAQVYGFSPRAVKPDEIHVSGSRLLRNVPLSDTPERVPNLPVAEDSRPPVPNEVRKPLTRYRDKALPQFRKSLPGVPVEEIDKLIRDQWSRLTADERKPYVIAFEEEARRASKVALDRV